MTIVWSRNTVRECSHLSFFCGGDSFCEVVGRQQNTHDMFAWVTRRSLSLLKRLADLSSSLERPADLCLQSKITEYCLSKSHAEVWTSSSPHVFFCLWLVIGTDILSFFPVIFWSYLQMEISVTPSIGNKLYSRHHILYLNSLWKPIYWCYLETTLNKQSSSMALCRELSLYITFFGISTFWK